MQLSGDECIEMKAIDMWERDVTRDGRVTTGKSNVGIEANRAAVASTRRRSAFLVTWTQSMAYPPPIELNGLGIVGCRHDGVLCKNGLGGKEPK